MPDFIDHVSFPSPISTRRRGSMMRCSQPSASSAASSAEGAIGWGPDDVAPPIFWILAKEPGAATSGVDLHISFRAKDRAEVHALHETALKLGARDAGAPGVRPQYTAGFYGCFVFDLDGFKIEAVVREAL